MTLKSEAPIDLVWGVNAIAAAIGRTSRQAFHLLDKGELPARKVGGRWVAERGTLYAFFTTTRNDVTQHSTEEARQ